VVSIAVERSILRDRGRFTARKSLCTLQALVSNMEESGEGGTFDLEALKTLVGEIEEVRGRAA
jgi:hypothetical protein